MWLINASKLSLELYYGDEIPAYAILSHTWAGDEVSFQEFIEASETQNDRIASKAGYRKIVATCQQALKDGYNYAWVDTCCIDKTSSAELTEAINSMFGWYRKSQVCYTYLSDFVLDTANVSPELLAPQNLHFFNQKWQQIGVKSSLGGLISKITGIPEAVLLVPPNKNIHECIQEFPIAARISWISRRQTTRIEDMSYSLIGILNVNMPMLYGEGENAFLRLQEEIIKKSNDLSIFAWTGAATASGFIPMLATTPLSFVINPVYNYGRDINRHLGDRLSTQFSVTNQGVVFPSAKLRTQTAVPGYCHHYILSLDYDDPTFQVRGSKQNHILLQKVGPGLFVRLYNSPDRLKAFEKRPYSSAFSEPVCILNSLPDPTIQQLVLWERYAVRVRCKPWEKLGQRYWHIRTAQPRGSWDLAASQFLLEMANERHMHIEFTPGNYKSNPDFKYFVLVFQIGDEKKRDPRIVSVRIFSSDVWQGLNPTMLGFQNRDALKLESLSRMRGTGDSDKLSLVGYDISVSARLVIEPNEQPYHRVYIDWEPTKSLPVTNKSWS